MFKKLAGVRGDRFRPFGKVNGQKKTRELVNTQVPVRCFTDNMSNSTVLSQTVHLPVWWLWITPHIAVFAILIGWFIVGFKDVNLETQRSSAESNRSSGPAKNKRSTEDAWPDRCCRVKVQCGPFALSETKPHNHTMVTTIFVAMAFFLAIVPLAFQEESPLIPAHSSISHVAVLGRTNFSCVYASIVGWISCQWIIWEILHTNLAVFMSSQKFNEMNAIVLGATKVVAIVLVALQIVAVVPTATLESSKEDAWINFVTLDSVVTGITALLSIPTTAATSYVYYTIKTSSAKANATGSKVPLISFLASPVALGVWIFATGLWFTIAFSQHDWGMRMFALQYWGGWALFSRSLLFVSVVFFVRKPGIHILMQTKKKGDLWSDRCVAPAAILYILAFSTLIVTALLHGTTLWQQNSSTQ